MVGLVLDVDGLVFTGVASQAVATGRFSVSDDGGHDGLGRGLSRGPFGDYHGSNGSRSRGGGLAGLRVGFILFLLSFLER